MTIVAAPSANHERSTRKATCLGCGCVCDDVDVTIADDKIVAIDLACLPGTAWFGDGTLPAAIRCGEQAASLDDAVAAAATILFADPGRLLIYVAGDLACETHREATALADRLGASIDGPTSDTVADGLLAMQRRGRASATLGELRHRADGVVFWGVDPNRVTPRFLERFVSPRPTQAPSRTLISVELDDDGGPVGCPPTLKLKRSDEVDALRVMQAVVQGHPVGTLSPALSAAASLASRLVAEFRYVAVIFNPEDSEPLCCDPARAEGLIALVQAMNTPTRAALVGLRAGGNRNGFESLLTWQTGYPFAVDFGPGYPVSRANETTAARIARGRYTRALVLGSPDTIPATVAAQLSRLTTVAVGPRAGDASFQPSIVIETGAASLHEDGLVLRMDDVPLQVRPLLTHPRSATDVLKRLAAHIPGRTQEAE